MSEPLYYVCPICGTMQTGGAPHGEGTPCPEKIKVDDAYVTMLEAQRMSYLRGSNSTEVMAEAMKKAFGIDD